MNKEIFTAEMARKEQLSIKDAVIKNQTELVINKIKEHIGAFNEEEFIYYNEPLSSATLHVLQKMGYCVRRTFNKDHDPIICISWERKD